MIAPGIWRYQFERKKARLAQYGVRVWFLDGEDDWVAKQAISRTEAFFESMGVGTHLTAYGVDAEEAGDRIRKRFEERGAKQGEEGSLSPEDVEKIILSRA